MACGDTLLAMILPLRVLYFLSTNMEMRILGCRVSDIGASCGVIISSFTVVSLTFERYLSICHPFLKLKFDQRKFTYCAIGIIWISAVCISFSDLYDAQQTEQEGLVKACYGSYRDNVVRLMLHTVMMVIPVLLMYVRIFCIAYKQRQKVKNQNGNNPALGTRRKQSNLTVAATILVGGYALSAAPFIVMSFIASAQNCPSVILYNVIDISQLLLFVYSSSNTFLYAWHSKPFKKAILSCLKCK